MILKKRRFRNYSRQKENIGVETEDENLESEQRNLMRRLGMGRR